ncbi:hypothetical protein KAR28_02500 [Candidatus Parcubacteria bacterium]|nr:hypothetical protein [Candidatus Parcubacteria bacterium]
MAQKIKRQIKRSMPLFIIFCLLTSTASLALVFNFDFSLSNLLGQPTALAQPYGDQATTTVTVMNAAPQWAVYPAEVPISTSTSPINVGYDISFTGTANDLESDSYYLAICSSSSIIASTTGGMPTCVGNTFCISTLTVAGSQATCKYNNVTDPSAEIQDWYAFACDNHSTEGDCSIVSQGANPGVLASSSPFWVNHAPDFTAVADDGGQDPGDDYTVTATVTDSDSVLAGLDELTLDICSTDSWATSTGCTATTFCTATSTSDDIICEWATTTPAIDGSWDYWAFVKDEHEMPAIGNSQTDIYVVNNVAPTVSSVELHGGIDITLNLKNSAEVLATATAIIADNNTCHDIDGATSTIYWSGVAGLHNCTADDDQCYDIAQINCEYQAGSCSGTSTTATYICSTTIAFHAIPTDGAGGDYPYGSTDWLAAIQGIDDDGAVGIATTVPGSAVHVETLLALEVQEFGINFGSIRGGQDSGTDNGTTTLENYGNAPINSTFQGDDLFKGTSTNYIEAYNQRYGTTTVTYASLTYQLASTSPSAPRDLDIDKPTTAIQTITDEVYWGIDIPAGKISGVYDGTNYIVSALDNSGWQ